MIDTLLDEPATAPKKPEPVQLRAPHDYTLVTQALDLRKEDLKKLSKKTSEEGYTREARVMEADALAIEHHILPAFREQREIPFVTHEALSKMVGAALKAPIWKAFDQLGDPKVIVTYDGIKARRERLLEQLTNRLTFYVKDVAEEAYRQGTAAREQSSEAIAARSIQTLSSRDD